MDWTWLWGAPAAAAGFTCAWQCVAASRFPLHEPLPAPAPGAAPSVTVFKPLKGADAYTEACLRSWFVQAYPAPVQLLFGVKDPADASAGVVKALMREHPGVDARLVICPGERGPNAKVSTLAQLEASASGEVVVVSDADVWAPPDLLGQIAATLAAPGVELANCLYRLATPATAAMRLEATAVNADFWSQVLQARTLAPQDFALGAVMALRRRRLEALGGFASLADFLADDFQLGRRVARSGGRIELVRRVVECWEGPSGWRQVWAHQTRWAKTLRVCEPGRYFASIIANPTLWQAVWAVGAAPSWGWLAGAMLLRMAAAGWLAHRFGRASSRSGDGLWTALWSPVRDLFGAAVWASAFLGHTVSWRGQVFRVRPDGRLEALQG